MVHKKTHKLVSKNRFSLLLVSSVVFLFTCETASYLFLKFQGVKYALSEKQSTAIEDLNYDTGLLGAKTDYFPEYVLHPYLGFVQDPNYQAGINKLGFFEPNPLQERTTNKVIIGIFGGSVAGGLTQYSKYLTTNLKKYEFFKNKELSIVSVSLGGFKQPQQLIALNYFLTLGGEFDIIINLDGFNEAALPYNDNFPEIAPIYPRLWKTYSRKKISPENLEMISQMSEIKSRNLKIKDWILRTPLRYSNFFQLIFLNIDRKLTNTLYSLNNKLKLSLASEDAGYQTTGPIFDNSSMDQYWDSLVDIWRRSSVQMELLSSANNISYFHFLQPNQYLPNSKQFSEEELRTAIVDTSISHWDGYKTAIENVYPKMINAKSELLKYNVKFFDLTLLFKNNSDTIYADQCCHYNEKGNAILAKEIAKIIGENYTTFTPK